MSKILDYVPQPDAHTCQSACIAKVLGTTNVAEIRSALNSIGTPGDPHVMGDYLKSRVKSYKFLESGSLIDAKEAIDDGCVVITHGWFTQSGHVICLIGHEPDSRTLSYRFIVDDPWEEFNFPDARYIPGRSGDNVRYSSYGVYAYCVASSSYEHAAQIYAQGQLMSSEKGAWLHIIKN
ncbi:hypothetical protein [Geitlerinema sp. PCC 7407]|uniref:hypothetical protein n=1 Tax=Geitlerinema sp. PCC 7407 TaxID=1173025 RepID=UPI00029FA8D7|nr:hypothetical protein [Geitlerinema sp. PCC 7407]AFY66186.1 hypothetical protein GEI7407_1697 [Geitlerinema sp. PCC 7407]